MGNSSCLLFENIWWKKGQIFKGKTCRVPAWFRPCIIPYIDQTCDGAWCLLLTISDPKMSRILYCHRPSEFDRRNILYVEWPTRRLKSAGERVVTLESSQSLYSFHLRHYWLTWHQAFRHDCICFACMAFLLRRHWSTVDSNRIRLRASLWLWHSFHICSTWSDLNVHEYI